MRRPKAAPTTVRDDQCLAPQAGASPERGLVELTGATCAWGHPASKTSKNR